MKEQHGFSLCKHNHQLLFIARFDEWNLRRDVEQSSCSARHVSAIWCQLRHLLHLWDVRQAIDATDVKQRKRRYPYSFSISRNVLLDWRCLVSTPKAGLTCYMGQDVSRTVGWLRSFVKHILDAISISYLMVGKFRSLRIFSLPLYHGATVITLHVFDWNLSIFIAHAVPHNWIPASISVLLLYNIRRFCC